MRGHRGYLLALAVVVALSGVMAGTAGAVVMRDAKGHFYGVALAHGVSSNSVRGLQVPSSASGPSIFKSNGNLDYNGGPVLHSSRPYLIFWDPGGHISAASQAVMKQYLTDVAADSTKARDVYSVLRQYTDTKGFADYRQSFSAAQAIVDTQAYPTVGNCTAVAAAYPTCLTDSEIQVELTRLIAAHALPTGIGAKAPVYNVITPQDVNICFSASGSSCGSNAFCAYHTSYTTGGKTVLYSLDPFIVWALNSAKGCQTDGTANYQTPSANGDHGYQIADNLSHEMSETITDPLGTGWWNTYNNNGQEVGDICATYSATAQPLNGLSPLAYAPTLGGTQSAGTLFDQLIHGDQYYNQSEWSNGNVNCRLQTSAANVSPAFTAAPTHLTVSVNPGGTSSPNGYSSSTWNFGDATTPVFSRTAPAVTSHTYRTAGTYTISLTVVDTVGNLSTITHTVTVS